MNLISVLIIDDHPIVLEGTKALFQRLDDMYIETEVNPENVLNKLHHQHYDIFLIDINMSVLNGISLAANIRAQQKDARIILYTGEDIRSYYPLIIEKKVDGILSKTASQERIFQTIRSIVQGDLVLPIDFIDYISKKMQNKYDYLKLTNKEKMLMNMLIEGYTNKLIAEKLGVAQRTAERYLSQLFSLLDVASRGEAIELVKQKKLM